MNRAEFMSRLTALLADVSPTEREEAIQYYNDYFDDAGAENEASVIASLGTPENLAKTIKAGLNDGGTGGEFTESGFAGYETKQKDEVMNPQSEERSQKEKNPYSYGGSQSSAYEDPYKKAGNGNSQNGKSAQGGGSQSGGSTVQEKKGMSGTTLALVILAAVLTFPVWIGIAGGLFGVLAGIFGGLFGIFIAFLVVGIVLLVVGIALFIAGIATLFSAPLGGLCMMGGALVLFAVGLVFFWLMVVVVGTLIPALIRGIVSLFQKLFHRGGAQA